MPKIKTLKLLEFMALSQDPSSYWFLNDDNFRSAFSKVNSLFINNWWNYSDKDFSNLSINSKHFDELLKKQSYNTGCSRFLIRFYFNYNCLDGSYSSRNLSTESQKLTFATEIVKDLSIIKSIFNYTYGKPSGVYKKYLFEPNKLHVLFAFLEIGYNSKKEIVIRLMPMKKQNIMNPSYKKRWVNRNKQVTSILRDIFSYGYNKKIADVDSLSDDFKKLIFNLFDLKDNKTTKNPDFIDFDFLPLKTENNNKINKRLKMIRLQRMKSLIYAK